MPSHDEERGGYHGLMATAVMRPAPSPDETSGVGSPRLAFRLGASTLSLEIADAHALCLIEDAYEPMRCERASARVHASLRRLSDGRLHLRYGRQTLRPANAADAVPMRAAYHAAREIFARFACEPAQTLALYGALCAVDGGAVMLLGPTTIGKTLLALHMAQHGARFLGDETALLSLASGDAYALPRRPALRQGALHLLPAQMSAAIESSPKYFETERGRFWYALDAQTLCGIEPSQRAYPLRAICMLSARAQSAGVRPIDAADAVKFLAQRAYARPTSLTQIGALRRAIRRVSCFEMTLGMPEESSALLLREVRACG